ncbi:hypothetical protein SBA4_380021 [Candidatus Sulfopaludibacter sp. SbA4]|nr:hypothetical protein SBA4_380021 [Candidatus Sulfopaludibacter sp. SbA4]
MATRDLHGGNSGWQAMGMWQVPGFHTLPAVSGMTPARATGSSQTLTFTYTDTKGVQDLRSERADQQLSGRPPGLPGGARRG